MSTNVSSSSQVKRQWHLVNAKNKTLGRIATQIAKYLMGKHKPTYVPYLDAGDFVVVTNAKEVKITGKKAAQKTYTYHSGFPGGLRQEKFESMIQRHSEEIIRHAIWGMVPKTKQGRQMIKRLKVFPGSENPYAKNMKKQEEQSNG